MNIRVLILGITGMLGYTLYRYLGNREEFEVFGTCRNSNFGKRNLSQNEKDNIISDVTAENLDSIIRAVAKSKPTIIINCIGLIKQLASAKNPLLAISINALLPHRIVALCKAVNIRLIHFSTDCVFSGSKGNYNEDDTPDAVDLYGRTKLLGEIIGPNVLTIRTSIIGHELSSAISLIDWFLSQTGPVHGYATAIYSGFPTIEMARILADFIIPNNSLNGLYHVASEPISKLDLLRLVAKHYGKIIDIIPDYNVTIDRSLDSTRFSTTTGYTAPGWDQLVASMYSDYIKNYQ